MTQSVRVAVPRLYTPPPRELVEPPVIVIPDRLAVAPESSSNTRPESSPLIVRRSDPGPLIVIEAGVLLSSSDPPVRAIVAGAAPRSKSITLGVAYRSAHSTAHRS